MKRLHLYLSSAFIIYNSIAFLQDMRSLSSLVLSGNWLEIENIELILAKAPNLECVDLDQSGIYTLPSGLFYNNHKLKTINVSGNYLVNLEPAVISNLDQLEVLDLSSNYFMGLDQTFFDVLKQKSRLEMVYLQNNQFVCDKCHIAPLKEWMRVSMKYWGKCFDPTNSLCLKCSQPDEYLHMPIGKS